MNSATLGSTGYNWGDTVTIAASDTVNIVADSTNNPRAYQFVWLYVLTTGNATVIDMNGVSRSLTGLAANTIVPFPVRRVNATGLTATVLGLVAK